MSDKHEVDRNEDPITGEPGSHPVGVGVGTAGGAATGAAVGAVGGPVGAVAGAIVGGVAGAFAGKGIAEQIDPTVEEDYWRDNHSSQEWASEGDFGYDDYEPAYRMGYSGTPATKRDWNDETDSELESEWEEFKGESRLKWEQARRATKAGWHRIEDRIPGDADGDGH